MGGPVQGSAVTWEGSVVDSQLRWVLDLLNEHELPYWLNSGTLLGLMREGQLLEGDEDIDLSLWAEHEAALRELLPHFKRAGYRVLTADYRGRRFQYNFSLSSGQRRRTIDLSLFRRCGEQAWCPEYFFKVQPRRGAGKKKGFLGLVRSVMRFFWRRLIALVPVRVSISAWPWRLFVRQATWWIPAAYFDNLEFHPALGAFIPADWRGYLEFRYGNWKVPCKDWVFHRDDRGLRPVPPAQVCGLKAGVDR